MLCELSELLLCQIKQIERKLYLGVCLVLWASLFGGCFNLPRTSHALKESKHVQKYWFTK